MNEKFKIILFPNNCDMTEGFSVGSKIIINKTNDYYHINYRTTDYLALDLDIFVKTISDTFNKNMPGTSFSLEVVGDIDPLDISTINNMSMDRILRLDVLSEYLAKCDNIIMKGSISPYNDINKTNYQYLNVRPINDDEDDDPNHRPYQYNFNFDRELNRTGQIFSDEDEDDDDDFEFDEDDFEYDGYGEDDDYDEDDNDEVLDTVNSVLGIDTYNDYSPFNAMDRQYQSRKKQHNQYSSSKVLKNTKHAKRDIKRHGIIITSRDLRDKDKKIIRAFLKDFIPGKSKIIAKYRKTLERRILNQISITKKQAKEFDKENKEMVKKVTKGKVSKNVAKVTNNILKYNSPFYDTSK